MNTFTNMLDNPTEENIADFLESAGLTRDHAVKSARAALKGDKAKANKMLAAQNIFDSYSDAVNFLYDTLRDNGFRIGEVFWPNLEHEKNERVVINLDNCFLVVCLYRFHTGRVECVAYVS